MDVITFRIEREDAPARDQVAIYRLALPRVMFVQSRPRSEIIPPEIRRQTDNIGLPFSLGRTRFQHSIIDTDVFAAWVQSTKRLGKLPRAKCRRNLFQNARGLRQM